MKYLLPVIVLGLPWISYPIIFSPSLRRVGFQVGIAGTIPDQLIARSITYIYF